MDSHDEPTPPACHGASIPDVTAMGPEQESVSSWRERSGINPETQIRLVKLSHMRYQHPDLDEITTFLKDFGMQVVKQTDEQVWYRGYGPDPYVYYARKGPKAFLGGTFEVESYGDLEKALQIPNATGITELVDHPGGGHLVTVTDPEGHPVNLIHGQTPKKPGEYPERLIINYETEKTRLRKFHRFNPGPAPVHKLGHFGYCVQSFPNMLTFYTQNFNLVPTDFLYIDKENQKENVAIFAHIDRGQDGVDHHSLFMISNKTPHVHHCSFEVHDFDTQKLGHYWLAKKGYKSVWGVGRHILGSQIFDYWWDTTGNMVEHYADGDLVNEETPVGYMPARNESLAIWGPEVPADFIN